MDTRPSALDELEWILEVEEDSEADARFTFAGVAPPVLRLLKAKREPEAVVEAIRRGDRSEGHLSDLVFFNRHPERRGRFISRDESSYRALAKEWLGIRAALVRPALKAPGRKRKALPPDSSSCGVPSTATTGEVAFENELDELRLETRAKQAGVQSRLCLFQNAATSSHRNHFEFQALNTARAIQAVRNPSADSCVLQVGATSYDTGADILRRIEAAHQCTGNRVNAVHIFGHSGAHGIFGLVGMTVGLYQDEYALDDASQRGGGRHIGDIQTAALAQNTVFFLHGCNQAQGDDNFARSLYQHLSRSLDSPVVYGHSNSGCAGRDNSWREYSKTAPDGRTVNNPPYDDPGGCAQP